MMLETRKEQYWFVKIGSCHLLGGTFIGRKFLVLAESLEIAIDLARKICPIGPLVSAGTSDITDLIDERK